MKSDIYNAMSDDEFRLKAFADYCDDIQQQYQRLIVATNQAFEVIPDDPDDDETLTEEVISQRVDEIISDNDIPTGTSLLFNSGYCGVKDYLTTVVKGFANSLKQGESPSEIVQQMTDAAGNVVGSSSVDDLVNGVKTNLYSLTSLCAANRAMLEKEVSDRLNVFNDKIQSVFTNAYSGVASTAVYLRNVIGEKDLDIKSYLGSVSELCNLSELADDDSDSIPEDSDIYQYTGASPICALNFGSVFKVAGAVLNAGVKVVGGIIVGAYNLVSGLFKKAFSWLHSIIVDPKDIEEINNVSNSASYTVDGWCFNGDNIIGESFVANDLCAYLDEYFPADDINNYVGKWIKYETIFGEMLISPNYVEVDPQTNHLLVRYKARFKPKSINPNVIYQAALSIFEPTEQTDSDNVKYVRIGKNTPNFTVDKVVQFIQYIKNNPDLYLSTDASEKKLLLSFHYANALQWCLSEWAFGEMRSTISSDVPDLNYFNMLSISDPDSYITNVLTSNVTNLDFIHQVTGWTNVEGTWQFNYADRIPVSIMACRYTGLSLMDSVGCAEFMAWLLNRASRVQDPINYTFVPYRNNVESFRDSRFRIRTDAENKNAFNTLMTIAAVIVVIAVISIAAIITVKKISRALYMKRVAAVGRMDNAMWNGENLTSKEKRKYIRLQRKLNGSTALNSGLQDAAQVFSSIENSVSTVSEDVSGVLQIRDLIDGGF